jgi:hypothetical protein
LDVLIQIADGARTMTEVGRQVGRAGVTDALQRLLEQDLVQRNGTCWMVTDPVLRCWLSTILKAQRLEAQPDGSVVRSRFEQFLRVRWTQWVQTEQLSFAEQVVTLFKQFCDDTVSLDAKIGRLPRFHSIATQGLAGPAEEVYVVADGQDRRWCASVARGSVDEDAIARFNAFCRAQTPRPSRKVLIAQARLDDHARLLAKAANMWVWGSSDLKMLQGLYDPTPVSCASGQA